MCRYLWNFLHWIHLNECFNLMKYKQSNYKKKNFQIIKGRKSSKGTIVNWPDFRTERVTHVFVLFVISTETKAPKWIPYCTDLINYWFYLFDAQLQRSLFHRSKHFNSENLLNRKTEEIVLVYVLVLVQGNKILFVCLAVFWILKCFWGLSLQRPCIKFQK